MKTLKYEEVLRMSTATWPSQRFERAVPKKVHNLKRLQSARGYVQPAEFEAHRFMDDRQFWVRAPEACPLVDPVVDGFVPELGVLLNGTRQLTAGRVTLAGVMLTDILSSIDAGISRLEEALTLLAGDSACDSRKGPAAGRNA